MSAPHRNTAVAAVPLRLDVAGVELGARVLHQWATLGEYDFVNIVEAPDAATVAKVSLALGARGSAKLQSLELVDVDTLLGALDA